MAIDTLAKRRRAMGIGRPGTLPIPDGTIDADDRAALLGQYFAGASNDPFPPTGVPVRTNSIIPDGDGVTIDKTAAGTLRAVSLNEADTYRISISHPTVTSSDRDAVEAHYTDNRLLEFSFSPIIDPYTYLCRYLEPPAWLSDDDVWFDGTVLLSGKRV